MLQTPPNLPFTGEELLSSPPVKGGMGGVGWVWLAAFGSKLCKAFTQIFC